METIIGLLIVILPLVFKLIGKKLEQAAHDQAQQAHDQVQPVPQVLESQVTGQVRQQPKEHKPRKTSVSRTVKIDKPVEPILKEEPKKKKEKIDVKKMIIYSEIMKPKY